jgi:hypothetical protein
MNNHLMEKETLKILNMLAEGRLTPEEADLLLETMQASASTPKTAEWLCIRVVENGSERVKVNFPIGLARMGVTLLPKSAMVRINEKGIDLYSILDKEPTPGMIVDIQDDDNIVAVYLE